MTFTFYIEWNWSLTRSRSWWFSSENSKKYWTRWSNSICIFRKGSYSWQVYRQLQWNILIFIAVKEIEFLFAAQRLQLYLKLVQLIMKWMKNCKFREVSNHKIPLTSVMYGVVHWQWIKRIETEKYETINIMT